MKVLKPFRDKTDNFRRYKKGDSYKHNNAERIAFLIKQSFIEKPPEKKKDDKNE